MRTQLEWVGWRQGNPDSVCHPEWLACFQFHVDLLPTAEQGVGEE